MANTVEILPKADYTVAVVGPSKNWGFDGNDGSKVEMATDSIQFAGHEQYWVDVNRSAKSAAPAVGEVLNGTITQDEAGKYPPKFNKTKTGGGGRGYGGGQASPGAIWMAALQTSAEIVAGYYAASGTKPKSITDYMSKVETLAPKVNAIVDKLVATTAAKPAAAPINNESGETPGPGAPVKAAAPAPAAKAAENVVVEDIDESELGEW